MHDDIDYEPWMDKADEEWLTGFVGEDRIIKPDDMITGYIAVIAYVDKDGNNHFRKHNALDAPLSSVVGLLDLAKHEWLMDNTAISSKQIRDED